MADIENGNTAGPSQESPAESLQRHIHSTTTALHAIKSNKALSWAQRRALTTYYNKQTDILDSMMDMDRVRQGTADFDDTEERELAQRALNLSFVSNIILLGVRVTIAALSGSLSLIIATIDAVLDVLSSCMLYYTTWQTKRPNKYKYPVGKHRLEPLGVVIFSCVMGTAAFSVVIEGIKQLAANDSGAETLSSTKQWIVIGGTLFVIAMKMGLFLYCRRSDHVTVQAFATDHLNDVLVNSFSLMGALLGANVAWWTDPMIAMLISFWVIYSWGRQGYEQIIALVGVSAPPEVLQKLTYLALNHRPEVVKEVDTVRAYTVGTDLLAEVDIVLPGEMLLKEAHDVGEELQIKLESLPEVSRAFVHLDIDSWHPPEH